MNLFRWFGWLFLLIGAGLFTGDVYILLVFLAGLGLIIFNPVGKESTLLKNFKKEKTERE